jgi:hypothetical protein
MKRFFLIGISLISFVASAQSNDDKAALSKLNAMFIHNFVTNDTISHNKIIHPDFVYISSSGNVISRKEYMKGWAHGFDPKVYKYWDYRDEFIRIFGTTALVRSINKFTTVKDGKETTGMTIYTDTYIKENGAWKCIQAQITRVDEKYYRGEDKVARKYIDGI